jgi:chemotaxis protein methyltransferase CheR
MTDSVYPERDDSIQQLEMELLLEAVFRQYGYDFRNYNKAHVKRRLVLHHPPVLAMVLKDLSINVTEMYRDPAFYLGIRKEVIPILRTYPFLRIWHAGCATGEEVYSLAILLKEEGLYDRSQIYATDFNTEVLETAKKGIYPVSKILFLTFILPDMMQRFLTLN